MVQVGPQTSTTLEPEGLPARTAPPRSAAASLAEQLGGEHNLRKLHAALADALRRGGAVELHLEGIPGSGRVLKAPRIYIGQPAW